METAQLEIQLIAVIVAVSCALPGVFLVLRRMAMMSDAISHSILLGIVVAFFYTKDLASPLLVIGAAATGLLTVVLVEVLHRTRRMKEDAAIGLVFPVLFSIAVILIARFAGKIHLDVDAVLLGELAFAPFNRLIISGYDLGPKALYMMSVILLINILFIRLFYKELKLATFDATLAAALGFSPVAIHYGLMALVSVTAVGSFHAVGSILVVALMIAPAASAYLLTDRLSRMLSISAIFGAAAAISGYWMAHWLDASIAGSIATMAGVLFGITFVFAPERGLAAVSRRRRQQRWQFAEAMLAIHIYTHEDTPAATRELRPEHLNEHLRWENDFAEMVLRRARKRGIVNFRHGLLSLTDSGRELARDSIIK